MLRGLLLTALLIIAPDVLAANAATERGRLQGAWTAVAAQRNGAAADDLVGHRLEFAHEQFRISQAGKTLYGGSYTIDPSVAPVQIDFRHDEGEVQGKRWAGIYRIEGNTLTICDNAANLAAPRPKDFAAPSGSGYVCLTFRR